MLKIQILNLIEPVFEFWIENRKMKFDQWLTVVLEMLDRTICRHNVIGFLVWIAVSSEIVDA
jgi:hypothetical protein